jgi:ATP/maltotriose-dependent transcriptional regulator MalT
VTGRAERVTAREDFARGDWRTARTGFEALRERGDLGTEDLALAATAAWFLGDGATAMAESETVHRDLVRAGQPVRAALVALQVGLVWCYRGDLAVGSAWIARARSGLRHQPRGIAHGYLHYVEAATTLDLDGDPEPAAAVAAEVAALAQEFNDEVLAGLAKVLGGLAAIRRGCTAEGFDQLEEAMLPVLAGRVDALWAGDIYCTVIHLCEGLADLGRMRVWTDALDRWATPLSDTFLFAWVTQVHRLQLLAAEGDWDTVEAELGPRSHQLADQHGWLSGTGFTELGDLRLARGDVAAARTAYDRARALGSDPQPGEALLQASAGDPTAALRTLRASLGQRGRLERARLLLPTARLALEAGERSTAEALVVELEDSADFYQSPGLLARAAEGRAVLLLAAGSPARAISLLERAGRIYRGQRFRYAMARVHEDLWSAAVMMGETARAEASRATALAIYQQLGAVPDVRRLSTGGPSGPALGLTDRETEVLACVASGASNREVAAALFISDKTVSRHLANIFGKLGVSSRTAAAAWAREHGVNPRSVG